MQKKYIIIAMAIVLSSLASRVAAQPSSPSRNLQQWRITNGDVIVPAGSKLGPQEPGVDRLTGIPNDVATGTMARESTATGGNVGGPAGRN